MMNTHVKDNENFLRYLSKHISLTEKEQQSLLDLPIFKSFQKGAILFEEGEITHDYYLIIKGGIRTYRLYDGEDITTEFYTENDCLIPVSTATKEPSKYYATCFEDSIIVITNNDIENNIFEKIPAFTSLCRRFSEMILAKVQSSSEELKILKPKQRYIKFINERADLVQRIPQYQLASYLGIKPESLSRIRKNLNHK
jgi:CRP-like cAMP-binding protein